MIITSLVISSWAAYNSSADTSLSNVVEAAYVSKHFDKNKVIDIQILLSEEAFADMMENPSKEEYKQANVVVNGEKVDNVGFRVKGNSSLMSVASSESKRFSFKIDFDQYIDGQSLDGLTKLNLNNSYSDPSYMREYLSYSLLDEMNIPTPAYCYANIYINGENAGLYLAVEGIEESFVQRYFGENYGNLYKPEGEGSDLVYIDDNIKSYNGISAVLELKNGSEAALLNMIKALNKGENLEKYIDVDEVLRYFAVNTVLVNMDSYQGNFKHNYYLYEEDGVFKILPWDYNMSFGGFGMGGQNASTELYIDQPVSGTTMEARPLISKLLEIPEYKELYHKYIDEFIKGSFAADKMSAEIDKVADMIRPYLEKDNTKFYTMEQFELALKEGTTQQQNQAIPTENEAPNATAQENPGGFANMGKDKGNMLQGGNVIGLAKFIQQRIDNVVKQLSGELPAFGTASEIQTSGFGGRDKGQMPPDMQQRPNMEGGKLPNAPGEFPGEMNGQQNKEIPIAGLSKQLYTIGGCAVLLLGAVIFILKKKTKYSL